jgi:hypothetical protein
VCVCVERVLEKRERERENRVAQEFL